MVLEALGNLFNYLFMEVETMQKDLRTIKAEVENEISENCCASDLLEFASDEWCATYLDNYDFNAYCYGMDATDILEQYDWVNTAYEYHDLDEEDNFDDPWTYLFTSIADEVAVRIHNGESRVYVGDELITVSAYDHKVETRGSLIGYKSVYCEQYGRVIAKLFIPSSASRTQFKQDNAKQRCEYAEVLGLYDISGKELSLKFAENGYNSTKLVYIVGQMVYPDYFDDDLDTQCSHGIHYFERFEDAKAY